MNSLLKLVGVLSALVFGAGATVGFVFLLVCIGPWLLIWSINTLFPAAAIPFTFWTWLAAVLLIVFLRGPRSS